MMISEHYLHVFISHCILEKRKEGRGENLIDIRTVPTYSLITTLSLYHLRKHLKEA